MNQLWIDKPKLFLIFIIFILIVASLIVGFCLDPVGFGGNLLAEIVGLLLGIIVTIYIVNVYVNYREKQNWESAYEITYTALEYGLGKSLLKHYFHLFQSMRTKRLNLLNQVLNPGNSTIKAMEGILVIIKDIEDGILVDDNEAAEERAEIFYKNLERFHVKIEPHMDRIRKTIIPRLIQYSKDRSIIVSILRFDQITHFGYDTVDQVVFMMSEGIDIEILHKRFGNWASTLLTFGKEVYIELQKVSAPKPAIP